MTRRRIARRSRRNLNRNAPFVRRSGLLESGTKISFSGMAGAELFSDLCISPPAVAEPWECPSGATILRGDDISCGNFFVDESGDPTFFDRFGTLIVGQPGCSPILILGFVETCEPGQIRQELARLHQEIAADKYLEGIPSIEKTNIAFHAKDDVAEVRQAVYKCLAGMDFKA